MGAYSRGGANSRIYGMIETKGANARAPPQYGTFSKASNHLKSGCVLILQLKLNTASITINHRERLRNNSRYASINKM